MFLLTTWSLFSIAHAGLKDNIIQNLVEQDRYDEARKQCEKWQLVLEKSEKSFAKLKESCAIAYWPLTEEQRTTSAWNEYRNKWAGTEMETDAAFEEITLGMKETREDPETYKDEEYYLRLADLAMGTQAEKSAIDLAGSSLIYRVTSLEDAREVVQKYPTHKRLIEVAQKYPQAFFSIRVEPSPENPDQLLTFVDVVEGVDIPQPLAEWVAMWPDGSVANWDETIRQHLLKAGIPVSFVMKIIKESKSLPAYPICPLSGMPEGWQAGVAVQMVESTLFEPMDWDRRCADRLPILLAFEKVDIPTSKKKKKKKSSSSKTKGMRLTTISLHPGHHVFLDAGLGREIGVVEGQRKTIQDYVDVSGVPLLAEKKLYQRHNKAYFVQPVDGSPSYITERPPSRWRAEINHELQGEDLPTGWKIQRDGQAKNIISDDIDYWPMPNQIIRSFSPLAAYSLDIYDFEPMMSTDVEDDFLLEKGRVSLPTDADAIDIQKASKSELRKAGTLLVGAGYEPDEFELYDGWIAPMDDDDQDEFVVRMKLKGDEAVAVFQERNEGEKVTYIFQTEHATEGRSSAAEPELYKWDDQYIFFWSGEERGVDYVELIYTDRGGFSIR